MPLLLGNHQNVSVVICVWSFTRWQNCTFNHTMNALAWYRLSRRLVVWN